MTLPPHPRSSHGAAVPSRDARTMRALHLLLAGAATTCTLAAVAGTLVR
jgi:hypothetical protein